MMKIALISRLTLALNLSIPISFSSFDPIMLIPVLTIVSMIGYLVKIVIISENRRQNKVLYIGKAIEGKYQLIYTFVIGAFFILIGLFRESSFYGLNIWIYGGLMIIFVQLIFYRNYLFSLKKDHITFALPHLSPSTEKWSYQELKSISGKNGEVLISSNNGNGKLYKIELDDQTKESIQNFLKDKDVIIHWD